MEKMKSLNRLSKVHSIEWAFGDTGIKLESFRTPDTAEVVINIHGTFGSMHGGKDKYLHFAETLQDTETANVVLYESSRLDAPIDPTITDRYKQKQAKFIGKTFSDELEDARRVVQYAIENSESLFWIRREDVNLTLNGNSLGGILGFYLSAEFPEVKNIVSVATGLRLTLKDIPILDTFPSPLELRPKIEQFSGKYVMIFWTEDDVFTKQSFFDLIELAGSKPNDKSFIKLVWVDHTFWKLEGEESEQPFKEVTMVVESLLRQGYMTSSIKRMLPMTNSADVVSHILNG